MTVNCQEKIAVGAGIVYLVLMALHIPLLGSLYCEDLLAPVLLAVVVARAMRPWTTGPAGSRAPASLRLDPALVALGLFLGLAGVATLTHLRPFPGNAYHWGVFTYLAVVFLFFRKTAFPARILFRLGAGYLVLAAAACLYDLAMLLTGVGTPRFSLLSTQMDDTALPFLRQRFTFTFGNPNLLGSFLALPLAMLMPTLLTTAGTWRRRPGLATAAAMALAALPLLRTVSKHALLSLALLGALVAATAGKRRPRLAILAWLPVIAFGLLGELSVLYPVLPLRASWPFLNLECPGMYMIHQNAYARMAVHDPARLTFGYGADAARRLYPDFVDHDSTRQTLAFYNALPAFDSFVSFMDPHHEYLHLIILFGIPATLAMIAFWILNAKAPPNPQAAALAAGFAAAVLFCCLWDDLLSKRWVWVTAALLANQTVFTDKNTAAG
jgi:hypothetical protein